MSCVFPMSVPAETCSVTNDLHLQWQRASDWPDDAASDPLFASPVHGQQPISSSPRPSRRTPLLCGPQLHCPCCVDHSARFFRAETHGPRRSIGPYLRAAVGPRGGASLQRRKREGGRCLLRHQRRGRVHPLLAARPQPEREHLGAARGTRLPAQPGACFCFTLRRRVGNLAFVADQVHVVLWLQWHIHVFPVVDGCQASSTGGHYNPFNVSTPYDSCTFDDCEAGDLSGKFGKFAAASVDEQFDDASITLFGDLRYMLASLKSNPTAAVPDNSVLPINTALLVAPSSSTRTTATVTRAPRSSTSEKSRWSRPPSPIR